MLHDIALAKEAHCATAHLLPAGASQLEHFLGVICSRVSLAIALFRCPASGEEFRRLLELVCRLRNLYFLVKFRVQFLNLLSHLMLSLLFGYDFLVCNAELLASLLFFFGNCDCAFSGLV